MMEGILSQRVTPLLKCIVLFLFIFTAKVLTSRPQESQDSRNGIHQSKPFHYVRTFTKYHHRRTIQWNNLQDLYWTTQDHSKVSKRSADPNEYNPYWLERHLSRKKFQYPGPVQERGLRKKRSIENSLVSQDVDNYWPIPRIRKRSAPIPNSNKFIGAGSLNSLADSKEVLAAESKAIGSGKVESGNKNGLPMETKDKDKKVTTTTTTTSAPTIFCLYKLHKIAVSATPSYQDEKDAQMVVEHHSHDIGPISETTLDGQTVQVEHCTDQKATCYALWHRHSDGNITILGQGCWHSSQRDGRTTCDRCTPIDQMQGTKFCCCTKSLCNAYFLSLKEESVTIKAESTMDAPPMSARYSALAAPILLALAAILVKALVIRRLFCRRPRPTDADQTDSEKGEVMGSGPDALATGLLCVDNLTLIEHIGQGKFGSVWRGSLGSTPVAVKLYSSPGAWQKEAAIYALPHLSHPNLLLYYGSDTRPTLTEGGGPQHLIVLELCWGTLRSRLEREPLTWPEFAAVAHGLASALAHLHTPTGNKPCVVHRDVNSNNVLISSDGQPKLADLGLAQPLYPRREAPSRVTEAGTLRYLAPEALEGALDLSGARSALCAVDVYALGLVLWEALWRCSGAHPGPVPPYAPPYQHQRLPPQPSATQLQVILSYLSGARSALCAVDVYALGLVLWEALWRCSGAHPGPVPPYAPPYQHQRLPPQPSATQLQVILSYLSGARSALCAVDVYALGLVLWEALWRCSGAHPGPVPPYAPPYQHQRLPPQPSATQLQVILSYLSGARSALCAVDVYALGLVLWEALWRCSGAHPGPVPPYAPPYQHQRLPPQPSATQLQTLVSRNKARPPLPKGPVPEMRALKIATDTCDECWDHDAEARLTAVCVEERMAELKQMLAAQGPVIHDNNLHPHQPDAATPPEPDKNSNCTSSQTCDVTTPLLYPPPHVGRNACLARNTHTNSNTHTLIHKSLKDIAQTEVKVVNPEENCLSVARPSHVRVVAENSGFNEIRSYQRPLDYVPNDVSSHEERDKVPKQTNLLQEVKVEKPKWGIRRFFDRLNKKMDTEVKLVPESSNSTQNGKTKTTIIEKQNNYDRPTNLVLNQDRIYSLEGPCTLSPPNRTLSPTMLIESDLNRENNVFGFKELPNENDPKSQNQIFAVIVPKSKPLDLETHCKRGSNESINKFIRTSMSSQSIFKSGHSESEDSTVKKRLSCDNRIITSSGRSSRASINLELQYINAQSENYHNDSPFDLNSDCSSSEDEHLMLLSENGESKITMQAIPKADDKKKYQNDVLKEASQVTDFGFNKFHNKYANFDNEFSDPNDKENSVNYSGDNPVYLAALNGEIDTDLKYLPEVEKSPKSPKPALKNLCIKRQHSLEQVSEIFSSCSDVNLQNPAGRVKTPGDLPVAVRRARRDRALQKGRASECNRLSLYDDRMMFGNSL